MIKSIKKILESLIGGFDLYQICISKVSYLKHNYSWMITFRKDNISYGFEINQNDETIYMYAPTDLSNGHMFGAKLTYTIPKSDQQEIYYLADKIYQECRECTESKYANIF